LKVNFINIDHIYNIVLEELKKKITILFFTNSWRIKKWNASL